MAGLHLGLILQQYTERQAAALSRQCMLCMLYTRLCIHARAVIVQAADSLHSYASTGDVAGVRHLLSEGAAVDQRDDEGCCALHWAADRGHLEVSLVGLIEQLCKRSDMLCSTSWQVCWQGISPSQ